MFNFNEKGIKKKQELFLFWSNNSLNILKVYSLVLKNEILLTFACLCFLHAQTEIKKTEIKIEQSHLFLFLFYLFIYLFVCLFIYLFLYLGKMRVIRIHAPTPNTLSIWSGLSSFPGNCSFMNLLKKVWFYQMYIIFLFTKLSNNNSKIIIIIIIIIIISNNNNNNTQQCGKPLLIIMIIIKLYFSVS